MERDPKVVACTAAMPDGTGINKALPKFPERSWDVGICESHALDMMAGLAKTGFKPFLAVYSTFFQRAFDQAFQEAALQGCRCGCAWTGRGSWAATARCTTGSATLRCCGRCRARSSWRRSTSRALLAALNFMAGHDVGLVERAVSARRGLAVPG
jgi:1-deoxy-D-xylulose-5-phosphate synthase